ncbi:hypothetical protein F5Y16DRAFT_421079 [Xylariaceae sp. FL0255]|nr:hypothetical protein F5Y16DRAFT_421079 [Xylariaceae sp. FL0255]
MAHYSNHSYHRSSGHDLNHKVSNLSEGDGPLRGRESLVSLQSFYEYTPPQPPRSEYSHEQQQYGSSSWSAPFGGDSGNRGQYQPVSHPSRTTSNAGRYKSFRTRVYDTIHEDESIDMSLLSSAAGRGHSGPYDAVPTNEPVEPAFDMTSYSGPMGVQDQEFLKSVHEQEASGKLTGGLGQGERPEAVIRSEQLMSTHSPLKRSLTRSFSLMGKSTPSPRPGLRDLGQEEANRRGEVIEVVMEEPTDVDLSNMTGPNIVTMEQGSAGASPKKQVFYPRPNWKPFFMRWPYLLLLILLSIALAIVQEFIYQKSRSGDGLIELEDDNVLDPAYYFIYKFVPTLVTVTYGVLWQNTDIQVRRLEAYYQMSKEGGASAAESINVDYITVFNFAIPIFSLHRKHYAVFTSSIATLLAVSLAPTVGAASYIIMNDYVGGTNIKIITVDAIFSRLLTATFLVIALFGSILFFQLTTRRSGLQADVTGIAGLASMAVVSHIMVDFQDMDTAKPKDIHQKLKNRRYELRNNSIFSNSSPLSAREKDKYQDAHLPENPHPLMLRKEGYIPFVIGMLLFFGFIPAFLFSPASIVTDKAPWVVTAFAVIIKLCWGSLETSIRMMEPYYILSKRHAPSDTLMLDYNSLSFVTVSFHALLNRHWIIFFVGWGGALAEVLTIFATSLAQVDGGAFLDIVENDGMAFNHGLGNGSETVRTFIVSLGLTVFILLYLSTVATFVFIRRRHPFLPRQPNTIASVLAFMHQSKMLWNFVGTARFTVAEMRTHLDVLGKTYGLGWFDGRDGQTHCGVDQEELTGNYKHGINQADGNKPWLTEWQTF